MVERLYMLKQGFRGRSDCDNMRVDKLKVKRAAGDGFSNGKTRSLRLSLTVHIGAAQSSVVRLRFSTKIRMARCIISGAHSNGNFRQYSSAGMSVISGLL